AGAFAAGTNDSGRVFMVAAVVVLVHSIVTVWNDLVDEAGDHYNDIHRVAALRKQGLLTMVRAGLYILVAAVVVLLRFLPLTEVLLTLVLFGLGWLYNREPVRASRRPVLSMVILALSYGALPFLMGAGLGQPTRLVWLMLLAWMLSRASLSLLKDYKDAPGDAQAGKRTFLLRYGGTLTARLSFGLAAAGLLSLTILTVYVTDTRQLSVAGSLCIVVVGLMVLRARLFAAHDYASLNRIFHEAVQFQLVFDALVILWLRIS
ncbi:MAG TPA: UbiA family prenyltransferase, partial [Candidatus Saccharimonadales bacterium]|nr:UbiA family prenyltransferase [Candidatus Saccharimonadales bacterium]